MSSSRRAVVLALVGLVMCLVAAPSGAQTLEDARRQQEQLKAQKAQAAAQLDTLQATDAQVEQALADLQAHVATQEARLAAARQAVSAAEQELAAAEAKVAETEAEIGRLQGLLLDLAVDAYVRPRSTMLQDLLESSDLTEATRRQTLMGQVVQNDREVIDALGAAREDHEVAAQAAESARQKADERRQAEQAKLAEVAAARDEQARISADLDRRIADYRSEVDSLAAEQKSVEDLIRRKEAELRASSAVPGSVSASGLIWPVRGHVTSEYGWRWGRLHEGIDIGAPTGTPIWAAKDGVVIFAGSRGGYGNAVIISHGGGFSTLYGHQSRLAVSSGQSVSRGQVIGYVGSTGHSTGPHLHFETRFDGTPRNPRCCLP